MLSTKTITLVFLVLIAVSPHNPLHPTVPLRVTLVTAWWPGQNSSQAVPSGDYLAAFQKLLSLPYNLIIFGDRALAEVVSQKRQSTNTVFYEHSASALQESWYNKLVRQLKSQGESNKAVDKASSALTYSRMIFLGKAAENDPFNTDQFIWVDPNALASTHIANILEPKNLDSLFEAFNHHFFMLPVQPNKDVHVLPNIEKTYYFEKFDIFVSSQLFGGKVQTIATVKTLYEDLVKVILQYDKNLWSEDAILGLLADRFPFTISYLTIQFKQNPPANRLLGQESYLNLQEEQKEIEYYEWLFGLCEIGFIVLGILLAFQVFKYLNYTKQLYQSYASSQFELEGSSLRVNNE